MKATTMWITVFLFSILNPDLYAQGNLVVNGGFDTSAAGWTLANGASLGAPFHVTDTGFTISLDNLSPSVLALPTASQTINSLTPQATYIVSGSFIEGKDRLAGGSPANPSFGVSFDNIVYYQTVAPTTSGVQTFSFLYTPTSSSAALSLSAQMNGTGISYSIDNISMVAAPEPSTVWLALLGSGVLFYVRRKRIATN